MDMHNKISYSIVPLSIALAAASAWSEVTFYYNQVGYDAAKPISIILKSDNSLDGAEYKLMSGGNAVKTGKLSSGTNPDNWLNNGKFYVAELEKGVSAGSYTLQVSENGQVKNSGEFKISDNALSDATLALVLNYFYKDRATNPDIVKLDEKLPVYNSGETRDVHGGWYDASGDVSKYLSHLSYANYLNPQQIPLTVWALAFTAERIPERLGKISTQAKTADEAVFGADFLVRMLDDKGFFYMTAFDNWGSPLGKRELCAFTGSDGVKSADYQSAFREGGGMAIAALARASKLGVKGDFSSEKYLEAAEKAFEHLSQKQSIGGSCEYCDDHKENIIDDYTALLAATELYAASQKKDYLTAARKRAEHLEGRLSDDGYFWSDDDKKRPFWHASDAGLPLIALVRYAEIENTITRESELSTWDCSDSAGRGCFNPSLVGALDAIKKHYNWLIEVTNKVDNPFGYARQAYKVNESIKDGFFIPHQNESNYWWQGESARIASLAAAAIYAFGALDLDGSEAVDKYATDQLDWILGKNPYSVCMMYGKGLKNPDKYDGQSKYDATLEGGIANGISGKNQDGSGIAWVDDGVAAVGFDAEKEAWQVWRWTEQWLPHSTWFLMALATRYDEKPVSMQAQLPPVDTTRDTSVNDSSKTKPGDDAIPAVGFIAPQLKIAQYGHTLNVAVTGRFDGMMVRVFDLNGRPIVAKELSGHETLVQLPASLHGVYLVKVGKFGIRKIVIK